MFECLCLSIAGLKKILMVKILGKGYALKIEKINEIPLDKEKPAKYALFAI
jgi:hypothetical protein